MITRLSFQNYRSHGNTSFPLQPINLLIGSVAAGKSNIFKGLLLLKNSIHRSLEELFPRGFEDFPSVRSWWADDDAPIRIEVDVDQLDNFLDQAATYSLAIASAASGLYVQEESLWRRDADQHQLLVFQRSADREFIHGGLDGLDPQHPSTILNQIASSGAYKGNENGNFSFAVAVAQSLSQFGYYHLSAPRLKVSGTSRPSMGMSYDGDGLADLMVWLKFSAGGNRTYSKILGAMQELLPDLNAITISQAGLERQSLAMWFEGHAGSTSAADLSDGTILTLALLCLVHNPSRSNILCIEEPETGLNPRRLRWLFEQFVGLAYPDDGGKATQVIFSTHSPWLVDLFGKDLQDSVLLVEHDAGRTRVKPLVEIQRERLHREPEPGDPIGHLWATGVYEGL